MNHVRSSAQALMAGSLTLVLSACGGGGGGNVRPDPPPAAPAPTPAPAPAPAPAPSIPQPAFDAHLAITGAGAARTAGLDGTGIAIGVIDSGVNRNHPALAGRVTLNKTYINPATNNLRQDDVVGHGTVVAQLAAGAATGSWPGGVAPGATVLSARIISDKPPADDGSGEGNEVNGALGFLGLHNDLIAAGMRVMNNSWGGLYWNNPAATGPIASEYRPFIFQYDGLVVFAAGNDSRANPSDMAALPSQAGPGGSRPAADLERGWLTVVALDTANPDRLAHYSNACGIAASYCLAAPGTAAYVDPQASAGQPLTYYYGSGTSYAAPLVSGAAALVWQQFPYFNNDNVRQTLLGTATDLGSSGVDAVFGHGLLNIAAAIAGPQRLDWGSFEVDVGSPVSEWGNVLSGSGGLSKRGDGHLRLTASGHAYTGATQVQAGTLEVNGLGASAVSLQGSGRLLTHGALGGSVDNAGNLHLDPANGPAIGVAGDYRHAASATLTLQAGDRLEVAGQARLEGGDVHIVGKRDFVSFGERHDVLRADAGVLGRFDRLTAPSTLFIDGQLDYSASAVSLLLNRLDVVSVARALGAPTAAALASAGRLEQAFTVIGDQRDQASTTVPDGFVRAAAALQATTDAGQARASLDSLSGRLHGQALAASLDSFGQERAQLAARIAAGHGLGSWRQGSAAALAGGWQGSGWQQGQGVVLGNGLSAGLAFGQGTLAAGSSAAGMGQDRQTQGLLWLAAHRGPGYLLATAGSNRGQRELARTLLLGSLHAGAQTRYHARLHSAAVEAGWQATGGSWSVQPYAGLAWERLDSPGFREYDALGMGLRSDRLALQRQLGVAGVRTGGQWAGWSLGGELRWQQLLGQDGAPWQARFTAVDAWEALDTSALWRSHGRASVRLARPLGQAGQLELAVDQVLGSAGHGQARLHWAQRF